MLTASTDTEETTVTDINETVDTWLAAWTEPDEGKRQQLIGQVWAADGKLVDPPMTAAGHTELTAITAALQAQFPAHTFRRTSSIDAHHDTIRYGWELLTPDGIVALAGLDIAEVTADGKLQRISGFFGELPAA
jgi:hypothetical protein